MKYYQCRMTNQETKKTTVGWIEAFGAKVGKFVRLIDNDNKYYHVDEVYNFPLEKEFLVFKQNADRHSWDY